MKSTIHNKIAPTSTATLVGTTRDIDSAWDATDLDMEAIYLGEALIQVDYANDENTASLLLVEDARRRGENRYGTEVIKQGSMWFPHFAFSTVETYEVTRAKGDKVAVMIINLNEEGRTIFKNKLRGMDNTRLGIDNIQLIRDAIKHRRLI